MSLKYVDENGNEQDIAGLGKDGTEVSVKQTLTSGTKIGEISINDVATNLFAPSQAYFDLNRANYTSNQVITSSNSIIPTTKSLTLPAGKYFIICPALTVTYNSSGNQFNVDFRQDGTTITTLVNHAYFGNGELGGTISGCAVVTLPGGTHSYSWLLKVSGSKQVTLAAYHSLQFFGFKISD